MSVSVVYHKNLECASRSFHERFQKDPNVSSLCFKGVLGGFHKCLECASRSFY